MQAISEIKSALSVAETKEELEGFVLTYSEDGRAGVQKLVESAKKRLDNLSKEIQRIYEMSAFERQYGDLGYLCGIDEVGRGPLAGPVYAAAVILPKDCDILYLNDGKTSKYIAMNEIFAKTEKLFIPIDGYGNIMLLEEKAIKKLHKLLLKERFAPLHEEIIPFGMEKILDV